MLQIENNETTVTDHQILVNEDQNEIWNEDNNSDYAVMQ
jgi:hypothetical protein